MPDTGPATPDMNDVQVAVIGLGYVGLPLAVSFAEHFPTLGFDTNPQRVAALRQGQDHTLEVSAQELKAADRLRFSAEAGDLAACNVFIVTVPTPIDAFKRPDFGPLLAASGTIAQAMKPGAVVIYESTVYPGATEEVCVPALERGSGLRCNAGFSVGYSPERINPGDAQHRLSGICKVTSGSNPATAAFVDALYRKVVRAGTFPASSIRVAEAAKVIENIQRDVNIALVNELAILFARLSIDTDEVLRAAGTKWNFIPFKPGLVGGHCIGVDPYYLTHKAQQVGHHPEMILAGRRINDGMGGYVAGRVVKLMLQRAIPVAQARILVMGLTFKENCPDLRNTRVVDLVRELQSCGAQVDVHDPWVDPQQALAEHGIAVCAQPLAGGYDAIVLAVAHRQFVALGVQGLNLWRKPRCVVFDVKQVLPKECVDDRL